MSIVSTKSWGLTSSKRVGHIRYQNHSLTSAWVWRVTNYFICLRVFRVLRDECNVSGQTLRGPETSLSACRFIMDNFNRLSARSVSDLEKDVSIFVRVEGAHEMGYWRLWRGQRVRKIYSLDIADRRRTRLRNERKRKQKRLFFQVNAWSRLARQGDAGHSNMVVTEIARRSESPSRLSGEDQSSVYGKLFSTSVVTSESVSADFLDVCKSDNIVLSRGIVMHDRLVFLPSDVA